MRKAVADTAHASDWPKPPFARVSDSDKGSNAWKLFDYWIRLKPHQLENAELHVYRTWPETDVALRPDSPRVKSIEVLQGKCPFDDPRAYAEFFKKKYGAGAYRADIVEVGVRGHKMRCYWEDRGNLDEFPPKLDIQTLIPDSHANQRYIEFLRRNNVPLPWEQPAPPEEEDFFMDMNAPASAPHNGAAPRPASPMGEVFSELTSTVRNMAEQTSREASRRADLAEEVADAKIAAATSQGPSLESTAAARAIELVASTSHTMIDRLSGNQVNPIEMIKAFKDLGGGSDAAMQAAITALTRSYEAGQKFYSDQNERLLNLLESRNAQPAAAAEAPKSLVDQYREVKELAEMFGFKRGGESTAMVQQQEAAAPAQQSWFNEQTAPVVMAGMQTVMVLLGNIVHNWAAVKFNTGQKPESPGEVMQRMAQVQQQQNGAAAPDTAQPQQQPGPTPQQQQMQAQWQQLITQLEKPFLEYFYSEKPSGYMLAAWLLSEGTMAEETGNGRATYSACVRAGKNHMDLLIRGNHNIWAKVQGVRPKYERFLSEFLTYDAYAAQQQQPAQPAATPPAAS